MKGRVRLSGPTYRWSDRLTDRVQIHEVGTLGRVKLKGNERNSRERWEYLGVVFVSGRSFSAVAPKRQPGNFIGFLMPLIVWEEDQMIWSY